MRARKQDATLLKEVATIRSLQKQAAEMNLIKAETARREAAARHDEGRAAVHAAEEGWSAATTSGAFELSSAWLHALAVRASEAQILARSEEEASGTAAEQRRAFDIATARSDTANREARTAGRIVARRRDEAQLAGVEDGLAARRRGK